MTTTLGCGTWRAFIACRGGTAQTEIPTSGLTMNRKVDDMSSAQVVLNVNDLRTLATTTQEQCCGLLAELAPWVHELELWRDEAMVWAGPVVKVVWTQTKITIDARDLFQWFERRLLGHDRDFFQVDLGTIFSQLAVDALHRDVSPNINFNVSPTGILGDRTIDSFAFRRAADELRSLAKVGLDFTFVGRTMIAGGTEIPTGDLGRLITENFDELQLTEDGLQTETESTVIGGSTSSILGPVSGTAGGIDADRGLVQNVVTESSIDDPDSAQAAAATRVALLAPAPLELQGRLLPSAPLDFARLIPGAIADLRLQFMCRPAVGKYRLQGMTASAGNDGTEKVILTFSTLGTSLEVDGTALANGIYTSWAWPAVTGGADQLALSFTPDLTPDPGTRVAASVFFAHQFDWGAGNGAGYIGFHTADPTFLTGHPKIAMFSAFGSGMDAASSGHAQSGPTAADGGPGAQTYISYEWVPHHRYELAVTRLVGAPAGHTTVNGPWWIGTIEDTSASPGVLTTIGYIQVPAGFPGLGDSTVSWTEHYGAPFQFCGEIPHTSLVFGDPRQHSAAFGNRAASTASSYMGTNGNCLNNAFTVLGPLQVRQETGL